MLPVTHGVEYTKIQILMYTLVLVVVSITPVLIQMSGMIYLAGATALGLRFLWHALKLYRTESDTHAFKTFAYSIFYLNLLFAFFLLDHYARLFVRYFIS